MGNNATKKENRDFVMIRALKLFPEKHPDESERPASEVAERFFSLAEQLHTGEHMALTFSADEDWNVFVSVPDGTELTGEDLEWIFDGIAEPLETESFVKDPFYAEGRTSYELRCPGDLDEFIHDAAGVYRGGYVRFDRTITAMYKMLKQERAMMRIVAGVRANETAGSEASILFSFPHRISLREKSMITIYGRGMKLVEQQEFSEDDKSDIPKPTLFDKLVKSLQYMMTEQAVKEKYTLDGDVCDVGSEENEKASSEYCYITIDELELSVRSYNCLKRAGINFVDELMQLEEDQLKGIRNLGRKGFDEVRAKLSEYTGEPLPVSVEADLKKLSEDKSNESEEKIREALSKLEGLIGLSAVKEQAVKITALARMKQDMAKNGEQAGGIVLNMEYTGNPGTAKTTVARIMAEVFCAAGLLRSPEPVEVGRADLVGKYVGSTAPLVREVFERAEGKLLFIDEAYTLATSVNGRDFGQEALNAIVQEMENHRDMTIVIFAGYKDEMKELFRMNPGLRSRVPFHLEFADYSADEMLAICRRDASQRGFEISPEAEGTVREACRKAIGNRTAGNGRFCRNLIERAILNYAGRIYGGSQMAEDRRRVLMACDFDVTGILEEEKHKAIGFTA